MSSEEISSYSEEELSLLEDEDSESSNSEDSEYGVSNDEEISEDAESGSTPSEENISDGLRLYYSPSMITSLGQQLRQKPSPMVAIDSSKPSISSTIERPTPIAASKPSISSRIERPTPVSAKVPSRPVSAKVTEQVRVILPPRTQIKIEPVEDIVVLPPKSLEEQLIKDVNEEDGLYDYRVKFSRSLSKIWTDYPIDQIVLLGRMAADKSFYGTTYGDDVENIIKSAMEHLDQLETSSV